MGWAGASYQYGILAAHWYWIGAIPAMLFLALVMMPFYYISKTHSVPGYLKLRFGESSRALSSVCFAFMTVLMSGINMYSMALVLKIILGWNINVSIWVSSLTVAIYVSLGGLRSAIFNEVLQFILIWAGALLIPILGLIEAGGWTGLKARIAVNASAEYTHMWSTMGHFKDNPMGIHWTGIVFGLAAVISTGYWTTDFLVVQRVLAAKDLRAAKMAPIIGAAFKMFVPFIVILPGLLGLALLPMKLMPEAQAIATGGHSYNEVLPLMLARYCGPGLLGLGITALIAGFMSGMAGNVSAFTTVWTYDIYRALIKKDASDRHYVSMGRLVHLGGVIISIGTAYLVIDFKSIMDYVQALFSFFIAPLFATVITRHALEARFARGRFLGVAGRHRFLGGDVGLGEDGSLGAFAIVALSPYARDMAENMYRALWSCLICAFVTVARQPGHYAQAGSGAEGTGLRRHRHSCRRARFHVPPSVVLGRCCRGHIRGPEYYFLVRDNESWRLDFHLVFYRHFPSREWPAHFRSGHLRAFPSPAGARRAVSPAREYLVGRASGAARRRILLSISRREKGVCSNNRNSRSELCPIRKR